VTELVPPSLDRYVGWSACVADFGGSQMDGSGHHGPPPDTSREGFAAYVAARLLMADPAWEPAEGRVPCSFAWIVESPGSPDVLGFLAIRHRLNDFLLEQGGHVGYAVRPSRRREGHAARALALALPMCSRLGIDRVLVTCDDDNVASARTIERNGGVLEDVRGDKRRYWITPDAG